MLITIQHQLVSRKVWTSLHSKASYRYGGCRRGNGIPRYFDLVFWLFGMCVCVCVFCQHPSFYSQSFRFSITTSLCARLNRRYGQPLANRYNTNRTLLPLCPLNIALVVGSHNRIHFSLCLLRDKVSENISPAILFCSAWKLEIKLLIWRSILLTAPVT